MRLYIIANRLPIKIADNGKGKLTFARSEGGLATGLNSLDTTLEKHWVGWPGICLKRKSQENEIAIRLKKLNFHPIFLSQSQYNNYYEGYSNSTLWPLCHYFYSNSRYRKSYWEAYKEVNRKFAEEVCRIAEKESMIWVQDYQLLLVPGFLRAMRPDLHIGFFLHIPFPSYELFRVLPEHGRILKGMLGADFIGFHTHDYLRHFISAVERSLHLEFNLDEVMIDGRAVHVDALPMGINYNLYHGAGDRPEVQRAEKKMRNLVGDHKVILSVDRLDYSKGILHRLAGFEQFLESHPDAHGEVTLAMIVVPSRDKVEKYAELKRKIDEKIGNINGKYAQLGWTPICYFYRSLPFEELTALYKIADIALVTPLRDGMNLVSKEYIATKQQGDPCVLILSEMAGAATELSDAIPVNPNDTSQIARAIEKALGMSAAEQQRRLRTLQKVVSTQTVNKWATDFVGEWKETIMRNRLLQSKTLERQSIAKLAEQYRNADHRLLALDYDGTLVPFCNKPENAVPSDEVISIIRQLTLDPRNKVLINSGRDRPFLEKWFGDLDVCIAAEHGASLKEDGKWMERIVSRQWSQRLMAILRKFEQKTPGSRLEIKKTALAWHYRESDAWLGAFRAQQLARTLLDECTKEGLQMIQGNKVIEIKSAEYNKGTIISYFLAQRPYSFVMAIGDDATDEDMFQALPEHGISIKVGGPSPSARYQLPLQADVVPFMRHIMEGGAQ